MKTCVAAAADKLDSLLDGSFGRARFLILFDSDSGVYQAIDNKASVDAAQGAGVKAAQTAVLAGAGAVITTQCGPKAMRVLKAAGVKVYISPCQKVCDAIESFRKGMLQELGMDP